jgi:excisionase family DNA binding protein
MNGAPADIGVELEPLLSCKEVAAALHVSKQTAYRWALSGFLPSVRIGPGTLRFRPREIQAWVDAAAAAPHETNAS